MTLYAADVMDLAKPIKKKSVKIAPQSEPSETVPKPARKRKSKKDPEPEPQPETVSEPVKPKKPRTEKQIAATERMKAARAAKKSVPTEPEPQLESEEKPKRKRKLKLVVPEKEEPSKEELDQIVEEVLQPKKKRAKRDPAEAPIWFQKYLEGVKKEQAEASSTKVPRKQIQEEAKQLADEKWKDGMVRDRVQNELDHHASRMYSMIFGRR